MCCLTKFQIWMSTFLRRTKLNDICPGKRILSENCNIGEVNSIGEINLVDCVEEIISDGDQDFIGCAKKVSTVC